MRIPQDTPSPAPTDGLPQVSPQLQTAPVERPRPAAAFPESDLLYQSLFEHMLEGLAYCQMLYDRQERPRDFVYLAVNGAFERLTGLKNVVGRPVSRVIPGIQQITPELFEIYGRVAATGQPERFEVDFKPLGLWLSISVFSLALANQHIATAMAKASPRFEWMHQRADTGETFPAEVLLSAMKLDGKSVLQAVVRNITDRKRRKPSANSWSGIWRRPWPRSSH